MLDYDVESERYDATRGGVPRARAAATAAHQLIMNELIMNELIMNELIMNELVVDCAGGTGIVSAELARWGHRVVVVDRSVGMLVHAARRLPGRVLCADATATPVPDGGCAVVLTVWLLHLLDDVSAVVGEAARMLRPGGLFLTTVDKDAAHGRTGTQVDHLPSDATAVVDARCADHGLTRVATQTFVGHGQSHPTGAEPVFQLAAYRKS